jgi:hypothetical protein
MIDKTDKLIIATVEAQRRGLPVPLDVLEKVYGQEMGCWYALRQHAKDDAALEGAYTALRNDQPERVRVIVSVLP